MKTLHVLYGFVSEKIIGGIEGSLKTLGYKAEGTMRPTKLMLKEYIDAHPGLDAVVIKEYLDGGGKYGVEELLDLADESDVNIVLILGAEYRGKDSMKDLYAAGILNAVFNDGKKGVDPDMIAELMAYGRTRKKAREYYKIDRKSIKKRYLTHDEFKEMYSYLADKSTGTNLIERFVAVSRWVSAEQLALFIKALPKDALDALKRYQEFYVIYSPLYRASLVNERLKCPKDAITGLPPESYLGKTERKHGKKTREYEDPDLRDVSYGKEVSSDDRMAELYPDENAGAEDSSSAANLSKTNFEQYISEQRQGIFPDTVNVPAMDGQESVNSMPSTGEPYTMPQTGSGVQVEPYIPQAVPAPPQAIPFVPQTDEQKPQEAFVPASEADLTDTDFETMDVDSLISMIV